MGATTRSYVGAVSTLAEAWPTEAAATAGVEAAARRVYFRQHGDNPQAPAWEDLSATTKLEYRDAVLGIVWAALEALPDPRREAWIHGYVGGYSDGGFDAAGAGPHDYATNPYEEAG